MGGRERGAAARPLPKRSPHPPRFSHAQLSAMPIIKNTPSFSVFRTAARGLEAQRLALGAATDNIANATSSRAQDGEAYAIKRAVQTADPTGSSRFGRSLTEAQSRLRTTDDRHFPSGQLTGRFRNRDTGPTTDIAEIDAERTEYDPDHPNADAEGYVHYPDVNVVEEMAHMISANRVYEANLTTVQAVKEMLKRTMEI